MTDLTMKGTKGRDCSPKTSQRGLMGEQTGKAPKGVGQTGVGTPMGGTAPEAKGTTSGKGGIIDPSMFSVDNHSVRAMSDYWEGKRAGPDWLHKRIEASEQARSEASNGMMAYSLPARRAFKR